MNEQLDLRQQLANTPPLQSTTPCLHHDNYRSVWNSKFLNAYDSSLEMWMCGCVCRMCKMCTLMVTLSYPNRHNPKPNPKPNFNPNLAVISTDNLHNISTHFTHSTSSFAHPRFTRGVNQPENSVELLPPPPHIDNI